MNLGCLEKSLQEIRNQLVEKIIQDTRSGKLVWVRQDRASLIKVRLDAKPATKSKTIIVCVNQIPHPGRRETFSVSFQCSGNLEDGQGFDCKCELTESQKEFFINLFNSIPRQDQIKTRQFLEEFLNLLKNLK